MEVGDIIEVTSTGYDYEGNAVCRVNNYVIFVEGLLLNEVANVKIYKKSKAYAFAEIISIIEKSASRIIPDCKVYNKCGGCDFMHTSYDNQLVIKNEIVSNAVEKNRLLEINVHNVVGMRSPWEYRNKVSIPVREIDGKICVGFYEKKSHNIVEFDKCVVQTDISNKIIETISNTLKRNDLSCYNEKANTGMIRHIVIRNTSKGDYMVVIVATEYEHSINVLKEAVINSHHEVKSIIVNINNKKTNVILGDRNIKIYGDDNIIDYYGNKSFKISPNSFFQINHMQTLKLYDKAIELASIDGCTLIDAYCGVGTISIYASDYVENSIGVDISKSSIQDAKNNAMMNNLNNVVFLEGKAEELIKEIMHKSNNATLIVDPPRKGCDSKFLDAVIENSMNNIVYISCNHNTLIRDIEYLTRHGYSCNDIYLYDMFPQTKHVECVCKIVKN